MTDQKPNCGNCPKEHTKKCPIDLKGSYGNSDIFDGVRRVTNNCLMGCHPGAKAWLMKGVIGVLESEIHFIGMFPDEKERGFIDGVEKSISLIRGDVG